MKLMDIWKNKVEAKHIYITVVSFLYIYLVGKCLYQYIWGSGIDGCQMELLFLTIFSFIVYLLSFIRWDYFVKESNIKTVFVPISEKGCIYGSIVLSLIITTFIYLLISYEIIYVDFYRIVPNQEILSIIGLAILLFLVFFLIVYFATFRISKFTLAKLK